MNPNFFTYIESIQVIMQTHQISAFNSASFRHFFKPKDTNFMSAITESSISESTVNKTGCDVKDSTRCVSRIVKSYGEIIQFCLRTVLLIFLRFSFLSFVVF